MIHHRYRHAGPRSPEGAGISFSYQKEEITYQVRDDDLVLAQASACAFGA